MNNTVQLRVTRNKSFVGCAMAIKVYFDNQQIYSVGNGDTAILTIPARPGYLRFRMAGSSMTPHPIQGEAFIDPTACRQGGIDCQLSITPNWAGIMVLGGLIWPIGNLKINLNYL